MTDERALRTAVRILRNLYADKSVLVNEVVDRLEVLADDERDGWEEVTP